MARKAPLKKSAAKEDDLPADRKSGRGDPVIRNVPAVTRAIAILRLLGRSDEPMGVNRIARALDLIPSTVLHILRVLMTEGFVRFDENTKLYELDLGVLSVAHSLLQKNRFIPLLQSSLTRLADEFGMTMYGVKTMGLDHMSVVASAISPLPIRLQAETGSKFPSMVSATGRCVAAFGDYKKNELKQRFSKVDLPIPMSFDQWWELVQQTKRNGYGLDDGTLMIGVSVLAVPIIAGGQMIYSIVAIGLRDQFAHLGLSRVVKELKEVAAELEGVVAPYVR